MLSPKLQRYYDEVKDSQRFHLWDEKRAQAIDEAKNLVPKRVSTILDVGSGEKDLGFTAQLDLGLGQDFHELPYSDNSFDLIWARHALEHSPMPYFALKEWQRVADYLLIIVPAPSKYIANYEGHYSVFADNSWRALFKKAGLKLIKFEEGKWRHGYRQLPELRYLLS